MPMAYEQVNGGVIIERESASLSWSVPTCSTVASSTVERIARESLEKHCVTLRAERAVATPHRQRPPAK